MAGWCASVHHAKIGSSRSGILFPVIVVTAFVIHFATGWTTFEREDIEFGVALLSSLSIVVWLASIPAEPWR